MDRTHAVVAAAILAIPILIATPVAAEAAVDSVGTEPVIAGGPDGTASNTTTSSATNPELRDSAPPDPETDRLGWEEVNGSGLWYNESIVVDRSDGLNATELDKVTARSMARVERVRELEFQEPVPVDVISRSQYRERIAEQFGNVTDQQRLKENAKWEAVFMIGESTDALAVRRANRGSTVGGFYDPEEDRIAVVSENETSPKMNEITLSQELYHALQGQQFDAFNRSWYPGDTREEHNAADGLIEGDGNLVDRLYQKRCDTEWDCLSPETTPGEPPAHFGEYLVVLQPYSDGPKYVQQIYREQGWEGVNALYDNPPASTEQVIHPEKYPDDVPTDVSFTDTSGERWDLVNVSNASDDSFGTKYASFGEAGLATMLFYPFYDSGRSQAPIVGPREFFNITSGGSVSSFDPVNYATPFTDGWDGDRLYAYATEDSMTTNETGYVWKIAWDSTADAEEFVDGYTRLLDYYGAEPVEDRPNTYRIPDDRPYGDAFYVQQSGDIVVLVNGPTVEDLSGIRAGAARQQSDDATATSTATPTSGDDGHDGGSGDGGPTQGTTTTQANTGQTNGDDGQSGGDGQPGFGIVVAVLALVALVVVLVRRR